MTKPKQTTIKSGKNTRNHKTSLQKKLSNGNKTFEAKIDKH